HPHYPPFPYTTLFRSPSLPRRHAMPITSKDAPGNRAEPKAEAKAEAKSEPKTKKAEAIYVANQTGITNIKGEMFQFRAGITHVRSEEHTSELQSRFDL